MQAIIFTAVNEVQFLQKAIPKVGVGKVLIKIKASGICHTDYEVLKDNYGTSAFPVIPGHEYAGEIVEIGAGVKSFKIGDAVVVDPNLECGKCRTCRRGWAHLCEGLGAYGVTTHGGFADYCEVHSGNVHKIGRLSFQQAALAEPMGCVLNGVDAVHAPWMENTLIFGAGPMGILMGMALKVEGVKDITFCDISENRLALAESFGFKAVASGSKALTQLCNQIDLVVEATGVQMVANQITKYIANGGRGLFFGVCPSEAKIEIAPFEMFRRQLTLAGSHSLNHNIPRALDVLEKLGNVTNRVISHRLPLEEVSSILANYPPAESLKIHAVSE